MTPKKKQAAAEQDKDEAKQQKEQQEMPEKTKCRMPTIVEVEVDEREEGQLSARSQFDEDKVDRQVASLFGALMDEAQCKRADNEQEKPAQKEQEHGNPEEDMRERRNFSRLFEA